MKFKRPRRQGRGSAVVELTPLIDVVFLLLIFFVVSTTFVRESALEIDLPDVDPAAASNEPGDIEVRVSADGDYAVNDRVLTNAAPSALIKALREAFPGETRSKPRVVVAADAGARHEAVVQVLDAARQLGLTNLSILTEARQSASDQGNEDG